MAVRDYFSSDYHDARGKFLDASRAAGAALDELRCPAPGPRGEALFADVAWHGPADAESVLVTLSATHGAEGFCGSGVQVGWLRAGLQDEVPQGVALMQIHAINPHGFAWLRRVTEDNVDLNRNFVDHAQTYPRNAGYEALRDVLCPEEWNDAVIAETQAALDAYAEANGARALQSAISSGQYGDAEGIFFGGNRDTWSRVTLEGIFRDKLAQAKRVAVIDYHTGLGPRGYGERICVHEPDSANLATARAWYEDDITSPALGTSSSVELNGFNVTGMEASAPAAEMVVIALEYGTLPSPQVHLSLRADNWLHVHGEPDSTKGRAIKDQIRDAFYQDADDWKEMVWERGIETQRLALRGLTQG